MKAKHAIVFAIIALCFFNAGCGDPPIVEGQVYSKVYQPESESTIPVMYTIGDSTYVIPMTVYDDEDWIISIQKLEQKTDKKGRVRTVRKTRSFYVTPEIYHSIKEGDWYFYSPKTAEIEDPNQEREAKKK